MGLLDDEYRGLKPAASPGLLDQIGGYLGAGLTRANDWVRTGLQLPGPQDLQRLGTDMVGNAQQQNAAIGAGTVAPGRMLNSQEPTPQELAAMDASPIGGFGTGEGGGGAFAGTFAGIASKTANRALLMQAKNAIAGGADPEAVRKATGWMRGLDGEWKYEISDHLLDVKVDPKTSKVRIHHPDLRRAYPDLMDKIKVEWFNDTLDKRGRYDPDKHIMYLNKNLKPDEWSDVVVHELQHPIQDIEGFSPGASPTHPGILAFSRAERDLLRKQHIKTLDEFDSAFQKFKAERIAANPKRYGRLTDKHILEIFENQPDTAGLFRRYEQARDELGWMDTPMGAKDYAHKAYERAMGEAEAREVQLREKMTPDERRDTAPYQHYDAIPPHRLIDMRLLQEPDSGPALQGLLDRALGASPEAKGTLASLLGLGLFSKDAE